MRYHAKFVNHYLNIKLDTNSKEIYDLVTNIFDFDDKCRKLSPKIKIHFILDDMGFKDRPYQKRYNYSKARPRDNVMLQALGEEIISSKADRKKGLVRGTIFGYREHIKEHIFYNLIMLPFQFLLSQHGFFFAHCSVVNKGKDCALITGPTGSGKSTLSVVLARNGFHLLTDDDCFIKLIKGEAQLFPFGTKIGLSDSLLKKYPDLGKKIEKNYRYGNKQRVSRKHISGHICGGGFKCKVILLPKYKANNKKLVIRKISAAKTIKSIANEYPHLHNYPDREFEEKFLTFYALTKKAEAFELLYNDNNLNEIPGLVNKLMTAA